MSSNKKVLASFIKYCDKHPEERFWQALRNWSKFNYVLVVKDTSLAIDSFYFKGKSK